MPFLHKVEVEGKEAVELRITLESKSWETERKRKNQHQSCTISTNQYI